MSYGDASGGSTRASTSRVRDHVCGQVIVGKIGISCNPFIFEISPCETVCRQCLCSGAHGLSEATAQGDWARALWSEMVLGLSLREWRERKDVPPLISVTDSKGNYDHLHNETIGPSEDTRSAIDLAIIREDQSRPQMFLRWVEGKAQVADALTKLHGDGDLLRALSRQAFTVLIEAPEIMAARRQERRERERVPRVKSPLKLRELVIETAIPVTPMPTVT